MVLPNSHKVSRVPWYSGTQIRSSKPLAYGTVALCGRSFHIVQLDFAFVTPPAVQNPPTLGPTTPHTQRSWAITCMRFRLFPFRSPLLRESHLLSLPRGTKMVQFPRFASPALCIHAGMSRLTPRRVAPFGNLRIYACLQLPEAYRSLLRPSSPPDAKASTLRS